MDGTSAAGTAGRTVMRRIAQVMLLQRAITNNVRSFIATGMAAALGTTRSALQGSTALRVLAGGPNQIWHSAQALGQRSLSLQQSLQAKAEAHTGAHARGCGKAKSGTAFNVAQHHDSGETRRERRKDRARAVSGTMSKTGGAVRGCADEGGMDGACNILPVPRSKSVGRKRAGWAVFGVLHAVTC